MTTDMNITNVKMLIHDENVEICLQMPEDKDALVGTLFDLSLKGYCIMSYVLRQDDFNYRCMELNLIQSDDMTTNIDANYMERILWWLGYFC